MPQPTMHVPLPPPETLLSAGAWCALLARQVAGSRSLEWTMRLQASVYNSGAPRARFPDGVPVPRHHIGAGGSPWFSCRDVASWLTGMGYIVAHEEEMPQPAPEAVSPEPAEEHEADDAEDAVSCEADEETRDVDTRPPPVSTSDIAAAFADIRWTRRDWARNLGKGDATSDWLESALVQRGRPGRGRPSTWNPVLLGSLLVQKGIPGNDGAPPPTKTDVARMLRERFSTVPYLVPWHRAWLSQEESLREYEVIK